MQDFYRDRNEIDVRMTHQRGSVAVGICNLVFARGSLSALEIGGADSHDLELWQSLERRNVRNRREARPGCTPMIPTPILPLRIANPFMRR